MENKHPVNNVQWIPIEKVFSNEYNPNKVATPEMKLLIKSIREDGYTQPIVCYFDSKNDKYIVVDGFHRYRACKENDDIKKSTNECLPIVVIDKPISNRMASTIRHNRARGTHQVSSMADIVSQLYLSGWSNKRISEELGMDLDEINRLKQFTGLGMLFKNYQFSKAEKDNVKNDWKFRKNVFT
ncbi:MAG: IbrB-like domain-containing protein [Bacteroidota bacterium]